MSSRREEVMDMLFNQHDIIHTARDIRNSDVRRNDVQNALDAMDLLLKDQNLMILLEKFINDNEVLMELFKLCHDIYTILKNTSPDVDGTRIEMFFADVTPVYTKCEELLNENPETQRQIEEHKEKFRLDPFSEEEDDDEEEEDDDEEEEDDDEEEEDDDEEEEEEDEPQSKVQKLE
jgi:hypothetical protein